MSQSIVLGHRGARYEAPENTLSGFRHALALGLSAIEFDVRMSADGELVVIHDDTVDRTTDGSGRVADLTLAELQELDARAIFPDWPEPSTVPTLDEVLDLLGHLPELMVEIKRDTPERLACIVPAALAAIDAKGLSRQVTLTSFDTNALELVQHHAPEMRRGYIGRWDTPEFLDIALRLGCTQADAHHVTADHELLAEARDRGLRIVVWPTNTAEELENVLSFEPDLFCTDSPTLIAGLYASGVHKCSDKTTCPHDDGAPD